MTRMPLRHIVISSLILFLSGCAGNLGDRVDSLEQRLGELEQTSQTQKVVLEARFEAINHELANGGPPAATSPAKGKKHTASRGNAAGKTPADKPMATAPGYLDPSPPPARPFSNPAARNGAAEPDQPIASDSVKSTDPVRVALADAKGQPMPMSGNAEPAPAAGYPASAMPGSISGSMPGSTTGSTPGSMAGSIPGYAANDPVRSPARVKTGSPAKAPAKSNAESAYKNALNLLEGGKPEAARQAFETFLAVYPESGLAPNAYYWLGESNYTLKHFDQAILTFKDVPNKYPKHPKAAAAMLKTAFAYQRLGDRDNARFYLQTLLEQYPNSEPASLARKQLASLK